MFYLINTLTTDFARITQYMDVMSVSMKNIDSNITAVAKNMGSVEKTLNNISESVAVMQNIDKTNGGPEWKYRKHVDGLKTMVQQISGVRKDVNLMSRNFSVLNYNIGDMNMSVRRMTGSVNKMSRPMDMFLK